MALSASTSYSWSGSTRLTPHMLMRRFKRTMSFIGPSLKVLVEANGMCDSSACELLHFTKPDSAGFGTNRCPRRRHPWSKRCTQMAHDPADGLRRVLVNRALDELRLARTGYSSRMVGRDALGVA